MAEKGDSLVQENSASKYGDGASWIRGPLIGKGSFGHVYKATPTSKYSCFPSEMAVKSAEGSYSATLQKEREIMSSLKGCPYLIQCLGDETTMGDNGLMAYNLLLEYGSGGTLADRIKNSGGRGLPKLEVRLHTRSILRGLKHIHGLGYVHRDLKPDNILLVRGFGKGRTNGDEFWAKICDFGLTKKEKQSKKRKLEPYWVGTPMYLSPEAVIHNIQDKSCDVWALGCVVLKMLTGKPVWEGKNNEEILRRIGTEDELPNIPDELSEDARDFLMCCLERSELFRLNAEQLLEHPFVEGLGNDDYVDDDDEGIDRSESMVLISESGDDDLFSDESRGSNSLWSQEDSESVEIEGDEDSSSEAGFDQLNEMSENKSFSQGMWQRTQQCYPVGLSTIPDVNLMRLIAK